MKKLMFSIISLAVSFVLLIYSVYAWFSYRTTIDNIIITTGNMEITAELYKGQDFDLDGILDVDENNNEIFVLVNNTEGFLLENLNPNEIVTFKIHAENAGSLKGQLSIYFENFSGSLQDVLIIDNGTTPVGESQRLTGTRKTALANQVIDKPGIDLIPVPYDFIFKLRFATLTELLALDNSPFTGYENLNAYQSTSEEDIKTFKMDIIAEFVNYV